MATKIVTEPAQVEVKVIGIAEPKGSAKAFIVNKGKPTQRAIVTSDNPRLKDWEHAIQRAVGLECDSQLLGPIAVIATFYLPRPKAAAKAKFHQTKPDLDKLVRSLNDAVNRVAFEDDKLIVSIHAHKCYVQPGELPHVRVRIEGFRPQRELPLHA